MLSAIVRDFTPEHNFCPKNVSGMIFSFWDKTRISGRFQNWEFKYFFSTFFWKISSEKVFFVLFVLRNGIWTPQAHQKPWFVQQTFHAWTPLVIFNQKNFSCLNSFSNFPRNDKWSKMPFMDFFGMSRNPSDENLSRIFLCKITSFARNICFRTKN